MAATKIKHRHETKKEAIKAKAAMIAQGKSDIQIHKFVGNRKLKFFVGTWWEWLAAIS